MKELPLNCTAAYTEKFLSPEEAKQLYQTLHTEYGIETAKLEIIAGGQSFSSDVGKIMFLDAELYHSGKFPEAQWGKTAVWFRELEDIKRRVEAIAKRTFNVCVCIHYPDGNTGVDYHSDYTAYGDTTVIASISIGEERKFCLREKETAAVYEVVLTEGSLLIMGEHCQERYEHSLPTDAKYKRGRINLTFRQYGYSH